MDTYMYPVGTAFIQFPLIALLLTMPYMFYNYHKYGSISKLRSLILFSFILYLQCAYYLVILPLPDPSKISTTYQNYIQLTPFNFLYEFFTKSSFSLTEPSTFLTALKESYFLQPLFNIILTIPFGMYLAYYFKKDLKKTVLLTFCLSLFFELTQLSGLYGIYPGPYRLFDIDDLMLNTLGGVIGYFIVSKQLHKILPNRSKIDNDNIIKSENVSYTRRFFAFLIDIFIINTITSLFVSLTKLISYEAIINSIIFLAYYVSLPSFFSGQTLGKKFVRIKLIAENKTRPFALSLFIRYISVTLLYAYSELTDNLTGIVSIENQRYIIIPYMIICLFVFIDFASSLKGKKHLWYERISKTYNINLIHTTPDKEKE